MLASPHKKPCSTKHYGYSYTIQSFLAAHIMWDTPGTVDRSMHHLGCIEYALYIWMKPYVIMVNGNWDRQVKTTKQKVIPRFSWQFYDRSYCWKSYKKARCDFQIISPKLTYKNLQPAWLPQLISFLKYAFSYVCGIHIWKSVWSNWPA